MKEALTRMADAYKAGVIDPTTLTNGTSDCRNKFYDDSFGVFTYWAGTWATNLKTNLEANGLDGELVALPPIAEVGTYLDRVSTSMVHHICLREPGRRIQILHRSYAGWRRYAVLMDIWCRGRSLVNSC